MKQLNNISYPFIGFVLGCLITFGLVNRYEPLVFQGVAGRLDTFTGKACVFVDEREVSADDVKRHWGAYPCK